MGALSKKVAEKAVNVDFTCSPEQCCSLKRNMIMNGRVHIALANTGNNFIKPREPL